MKAAMEIITDHIHCRQRILLLAKSHLHKTYKGAALGWSWAVIRPTITVLLYLFAFTVGIRVGKEVEGYAYYLWLLAGMIPWFYIQGIFVSGAGALRSYRFLVTKIRYPISTIPTFVNLSGFLVHLILMGVLLIMYMLAGHWPDIYWIQLIFWEALMFIFFDAWAIFASIISAFSVDFYNLVRASTMVLFWMSSIFYDPKKIEPFILRAAVLYNPVTIFVEGIRDSLIYKNWFWQDARAVRYFLVEYAILAVLTAVFYRRLKNDIPDVL